VPAKKKTETTELVIPAEALPGEVQPDAALVDTAVEQINRLYIAKGLETAQVIGEYVLETFFGGDPSAFRDREGGHASFRALASRDDLHVSHVWLWRAVSVVEQLRQLPAEVGSNLPFTHHTLLLPIKSERAKLRLAKRAAEKGWTKRKLDAEVRKVRDKEKQNPNAGRPRLPRFVKTLNKLGRLLADPAEAFGDLDAIESMEPAQAQRLLGVVAGVKAQCEAIELRLRERITPAG